MVGKKIPKESSYFGMCENDMHFKAQCPAVKLDWNAAMPTGPGQVFLCCERTQLASQCKGGHRKPADGWVCGCPQTQTLPQPSFSSPCPAPEATTAWRAFSYFSSSHDK